MTGKDIAFIFKIKISGTLSAEEIMEEYDLNKNDVITREEYITRSITTFRTAKKTPKGVGR